MDSSLSLLPNYKITRAPLDIIAKIVIERLGIVPTADGKNYLIERLRKNDKLHVLVADILRTYSGPLAPFLQISQTHNIVPTVLRNQLATLISWDAIPSSLQANYIALWADDTLPTVNDTTLSDETVRQLFTNRYSSGSTAYLDAFFASSVVAGNTYLEAGIFCDGTASADTGYLLSRILMDETLSPNETLTINATITIANAS